MRCNEGKERDHDHDLLKAAGTPIMRPFPVSSLERFTLSPGEDSWRSTSGILSPTLTILAVVVAKKRVVGRSPD